MPTGYYLTHRYIERLGGGSVHLAGPFIDAASAATNREKFERRAVREGMACSDGGYTIISVENAATLPRGRYTPVDFFAPILPGLL